MPKTKFQESVFTLMMVFAMVFVMTVYNIAMEKGGLDYLTFKHAILSMWIIFVIAFIIEKFIIAPTARKIVFKILSPMDKPIFIIIAHSCIMVSLMSPTISLILTIMHHGFIIDIPVIWMTTLFKNFPMALFSQIFFVGPFVRLLFRAMFKNQLVLEKNLKL